LIKRTLDSNRASFWGVNLVFAISEVFMFERDSRLIVKQG
jgi:hypothetical protein